MTGAAAAGGAPEQPRRGTPAHRRLVVRAVAVGALPPAVLLLGIGSMRAFDLAATSGELGWNDVAGALAVAQILVAVGGFVALLDARTRVTGLVAILFALLVNPWLLALLPALTGAGA